MGHQATAVPLVVAQPQHIDLKVLRRCYSDLEIDAVTGFYGKIRGVALDLHADVVGNRVSGRPWKLPLTAARMAVLSNDGIRITWIRECRTAGKTRG